MLKKIFIISLFCGLLAPISVWAQDNTAADKIFKAGVSEVTSQQVINLPDGTSGTQQDLKLTGTENEFKNKEIFIKGVGDQTANINNIYRVGDEVLVTASKDEQGNDKYYITDYVRTKSILWLFLVFVVAIVAVGRWKGLRSIISLALTFLVMIKYIVPQILDGADPIIVTIIGSLAILVVIIYLTEGLTMNANISVASIFISLLLTVALSWLFVHLARLSGMGNEEASFIANLGTAKLNLQGILLAGIIIGTLGVLDDVVISQVASVEELDKANSGLTRKEIFSKAHRVGVAHISSMTNTLFLAYAGASLPLMILFVSGQSAFASWDIAINNELLATEIVRSLAGSIGLILAVPISTILAVLWVKRKK
ncbi:MAG: YibE/F family protein [Candidatus Margulisiibacteriota bacterium]